MKIRKIIKDMGSSYQATLRAEREVISGIISDFKEININVIKIIKSLKKWSYSLA